MTDDHVEGLELPQCFDGFPEDWRMFFEHKFILMELIGGHFSVCESAAA